MLARFLKNYLGNYLINYRVSNETAGTQGDLTVMNSVKGAPALSLHTAPQCWPPSKAQLSM